eukprot:jgi/Mesvir1/12335/Mv00521-RA.2
MLVASGCHKFLCLVRRTRACERRDGSSRAISNPRVTATQWFSRKQPCSVEKSDTSASIMERTRRKCDYNRSLLRAEEPNDKGFDVRRPFVDERRTVELGLLASAGLLGVAGSAQAADIGTVVSEGLFSLGQWADAQVSDQLAALTPASVGIIFLAGLATSFTPCTLSVLPLTIGYIAGYGEKEGEQSNQSVAGKSLAFAMGLATTFAALGVVSSLAGRAYGQIGNNLPVAVALVAMLMGLNLLEVLPFLRLPSFGSDFDIKRAAPTLPPVLQAYMAGLVFALAASPCSTPVLASLLAYVATLENPALGGGLLLAYTTGYVAPLLIAATFTTSLKDLLSMRKYSAWITPAR